MKRIVFVLMTMVLGACAGAFCWAFFYVMDTGIDFLWDKVPRWIAAAGMPAVAYPLVFCVVGGVAVGLFQKHVGPYPDSMNEVLAQVKKTGRYDYRHLKAVFAGALLPLLFGGSIGPEAGVTGVVAGLCSWVGDRLKFMGSEMRDLAGAGTAAIISALFSAPLFGFAAPLLGYADDADGEHGEAGFDTDERQGDGKDDRAPADGSAHKDRRMRKLVKAVVYLLSAASALGVFMLLNKVIGGGLGIPRFSDVAAGARELAWALPVAALGASAGWLFHVFGWAVAKVSARLGDRTVLKAVLAGAVLGGLGIFLPLTMFAGEAQTALLNEEWTRLGAAVLLATGFLKVLITQVCLGLGWRGGHFFPLIFSGIAIGYAAAALFGIDPVFALSVATAALLGAAMRRPVMVALLLMLCFPVKAVAFVLAAAWLGSVIPVPKALFPKVAAR